MRAFAVVSVIINHFNKNILPGGYLGVDIFFVISGFVITSSLYKRPSKDFKDFISGFYERRIRRLVPSLVVFVFISSIAICLFNPSVGISLRTGLTSLFGFSNLYLLNQSTDYFAPSTELNVFTHTWSLGVEEQFYILFPFLIWFSGFGKQTHYGARNLSLIIASLTITSLIFFIFLYARNQPAAYFLMPTRFWEMATGCLVFLRFQKRTFLDKYLNRFPPFFILVLIISVMYLPISWAVYSTIAVVILTSILIGSFNKNTFLYRVFTNSRIIYIGLISYSLYLWHWSVLSISRWTIGIHWWSVPFQILIILGLSMFSYHFIEKPTRKQLWFGRRWKTIALGTLSLFITFLSVRSIPNSPAKQFFESIRSKMYPPSFKITTGVPQYELYCLSPKNFETLLKDCLSSVADDSSSRRIFLIGDSHASNHHWSINSALKMTNSPYSLRTLVESGFVWYLMGEDKKCRSLKSCISNAGESYKNYFKRNLSKKDYVFITMARDRYTFGDFKGVARRQNISRTKILKRRLLDILQLVNERGAKLVLIGDIPKVCPEGINYLHNIVIMGKTFLCNTERSISIEDRVALNNVFIEITKSSKNAIYVDPHDKLCIKDKCGVTDKRGELLYWDTSPHFLKNNKDILKNYWADIFIKIGIAD